jgi:hypothetical protein
VKVQKVVVQQLMIDASDTIPEGTPCIVIRNCKRNADGLVENISYTMQVPIWLAPESESDDDAGEATPQTDNGDNTEPAEEPETATDEGDQ